MAGDINPLSERISYTGKPSMKSCLIPDGIAYLALANPGSVGPAPVLPQKDISRYIEARSGGINADNKSELIAQLTKLKETNYEGFLSKLQNLIVFNLQNKKILVLDYKFLADFLRDGNFKGDLLRLDLKIKNDYLKNNGEVSYSVLCDWEKVKGEMDVSLRTSLLGQDSTTSNKKLNAGATKDPWDVMTDNEIATFKSLGGVFFRDDLLQHYLNPDLLNKFLSDGSVKTLIEEWERFEGGPVWGGVNRLLLGTYETMETDGTDILAGYMALLQLPNLSLNTPPLNFDNLDKFYETYPDLKDKALSKDNIGLRQLIKDVLMQKYPMERDRTIIKNIDVNDPGFLDKTLQHLVSP